MKKYLVYAAVALGLAFWAWIGWFYILPVAVFLFKLMVERQGFVPACGSMALTLTVILWVYYAATANLKRVIDAGTAPMLMQVLGYLLVLPPMLALDWLLNMTVFTVLFGDPPESWTELVTGRLKRYAYLPKHQGTKRQKAAQGFALILDELDPSGKHI